MLSMIEATRAQDISEQEANELREIRAITSTDTGEFISISSKELDSLESGAWRKFLDRKKFRDTWIPGVESPYRRFAKTRTIHSIQELREKIRPRHNGADIRSENGIKNLIKTGLVGPGTAVILDSGGPHSAAMAVELAKHSYQPIVMFDSVPHSNGRINSEQGLAVLLYFAQEMHELKSNLKITTNSPPVFVLDTHRNDRTLRADSVNNAYVYSESDFPSAMELKSNNIDKVIYVSEVDDKGKINPDFQSDLRLMSDINPVVKKWQESGITIMYTGVNPDSVGEGFQAPLRETYLRQINKDA